MKNLLLSLSLIILLASCASKRKVYQKENKQVEKTANKISGGNYISYDTQSYIDRFKNIAVTEMNKYGIPASITLAQALLESGTGNSDLAKYANNHFGIKCTSDWSGKGYYKDDDKKDDCFRVYNNPEESFKDHSEFLKRKRYAFLFELDKNDYEGWAKGLKQAGYATNPRYPTLLISIIEKYDLHQYDKREGEIDKIKREDRVLSDINKNIPKEQSKDRKTDAPPVIAGDKYLVQQGDTLYNISKRFGLTVEQLKALNNMNDSTIKIGQEITIKK
ncbi:glucosaminidase domain-containing protein [Pedobacter sp. SD-b]|uniref:Peptidoglycan hydrolase n=1 Tax=Pedobacter segetis TaxID=2793069 RepID=A0ABS1BJP2_9SPHI|nr:glucosaminidase domain-containing protein [Pedobacter segetis]MBK0383113.1 glucosaminidase domain-containing protein [Pedobacter segetis]